MPLPFVTSIPPASAHTSKSRCASPLITRGGLGGEGGLPNLPRQPGERIGVHVWMVCVAVGEDVAAAIALSMRTRLKPRTLGLIPQPLSPTGLRVRQCLDVVAHACMSFLLVERALCVTRCSQRSASPT